MERRDERAIAFGQAVKRIREGKGLLQREVVDRLKGVYSDPSTYGRIERGERLPLRRDALAILTRGLEIRDPKQVNELVMLAGYESTTNVLKDGKTAEKDDLSPAEAPIATEIQHRTFPLFASKKLVVGVALAAVAVVLFGAGAREQTWFIDSSVLLYSSLYVVSVLLETAYLDDKTRVAKYAAAVFCFIATTSAFAVYVDFLATRSRKQFGLAVSASILIACAVGQWFIARPCLPARVLVGTHTSQAAHLKNTLYFLFFALCFWAPPFHCVVALRYAADIVNPAALPGIISNWWIAAHGVICPGVYSLVCLFVALIPLSIAMRSPILDRLKGNNDHQNLYMLLFYFRAILFFAACILCLAWFSSNLSPAS